MRVAWPLPVRPMTSLHCTSSQPRVHVAVSGLSLSEVPLGRMVWGEVKTGTLIGAILAALAFAGVVVAFRNVRLGLAVGASILAAGMTAAAVGIGFPALLAHFKKDPAFGSGPLATRSTSATCIRC